jgi:hypothetical protein
MLRFIFFIFLKAGARLFYNFSVIWDSPVKDSDWRELRLIVLLNHTSLFEPLFGAVLPNKLLWRIAKYGCFPGAQETLARPIVGRIFKTLSPRVVSISRKRDESWQAFMQQLSPDSLLIMAPEGRMKRPSGFDKHGNPMTVKTGIVDVIDHMKHGKMLFACSHGLHHVQSPGQGFPKLFKRIGVTLAVANIDEFRNAFEGLPPDARIKAIVADLERRRDEAL